MADLDRFRGCLLGLAIGDAVGTTVEFRQRGTFARVSDMVGRGPFGLAPGQWTDDTSMALCLADSLLERGGFDPADQMDRYLRWWREGYRSSTGECFDIGTTVARALQRYCDTGEPFAGSTDPHTAGNGCIMRLAPVPMFYYPDAAAARRYAGDSSRTTHAADDCIDAARLLAGMLCRALDGATKHDVLLGDAETDFTSPNISALARGAYLHFDEEQIRGTGYVVASLEAAAWCLAQSDTFDAAVLRAANLGDDADTTAAVCGQLAGAVYGEGGIPRRWLNLLTMKEEIAGLAQRLWAHAAGKPEMA
jgi:ADP-ribosyl-[dinitrogen reductase] hydrolase